MLSALCPEVVKELNGTKRGPGPGHSSEHFGLSGEAHRGLSPTIPSQETFGTQVVITLIPVFIVLKSRGLAYPLGPGHRKLEDSFNLGNFQPDVMMHHSTHISEPVSGIIAFPEASHVSSFAPVGPRMRGLPPEA